jgi:Protein of unknown function (DUF2652)
MANKGYLIITDISGYTEFLTKSEIDHAQDAIQSLFDVQINNIRHPFVISGFRGDAIFMYLPDTHYEEPQTVLESLENLYFVFADTLRQIQFNTTCTCRACKNMKNLDLKMVIHHGEYVIQKLGDHEELMGADVIVPHRMLKNHVIEETGIPCYALFSEEAADALGLAELAQPLVPHTETYEHIGEVKMQVLDLHKAWEQEQGKKRIFISPESAFFTFEWDIPFPISIVWEFLTVPRLALIYEPFDIYERVDSLGGRTQPGTTFHCAHGDDFNVTLKILDWMPYDYMTVENDLGNVKFSQTRIFTPTDAGTKVQYTQTKPLEPGAEEFRSQWLAGHGAVRDNFIKAIESEIASGNMTLA